MILSSCNYPHKVNLWKDNTRNLKEESIKVEQKNILETADWSYGYNYKTES